MTKQMSAALAAKDGSKRTVGLFAVLAAAVALIMAMAAPASAQTTVEGADGNVWVPDSIDITAGDTVTFNMTGGDGGHDGQIDGEVIFPFTPVGSSVDATFNDPGTFTLVCTLHPGMEMTINVAEGDGGADNGDADNGDADNGDADNGDADNGDADNGDADNGDADNGDADVEQPTEVASGTGGLLAQNSFPMWVAALMVLGVLALFAPAAVARRRS